MGSDETRGAAEATRHGEAFTPKHISVLEGTKGTSSEPSDTKGRLPTSNKEFCYGLNCVSSRPPPMLQS